MTSTSLPTSGALDDAAPPLSGIRVVDFSQLIAGPSMAMMLADLGADVVKVERLEGELCRSVGAADGMPPTFLAYNRGKRSLALDLGARKGRDVARRLIERADVVIESFRPGVMARLGLDHASIAGAAPGVVYLSLSAYNEEGVGAGRPGVDAVVQAESGFMAVTGHPDGKPMKVGFQIVDAATGLAGVQAVLAALLRRERTGAGSHLKLSLFEVATFVQSPAFIQASLTGRPTARPGNTAGHLGSPTDLFATADGGYVMIAAYFPQQWSALCAAIASPELESDPRFATNRDRIRNNDELSAVLQVIFGSQPKAHWVATLAAHGVIGGPVRDHLEIVGDADVRSNGNFEHSEGPSAPFWAPAVPFRTQSWGHPPRRKPPVIGEHTEEVLVELEYSLSEIADLVANGSVRQFGAAPAGVASS